MKSKIKRHSRSVLAVILTLSMLVSCMMVGLIATDAAIDWQDYSGNIHHYLYYDDSVANLSEGGTKNIYVLMDYGSGSNVFQMSRVDSKTLLYRYDYENKWVGCTAMAVKGASSAPDSSTRYTSCDRYNTDAGTMNGNAVVYMYGSKTGTTLNVSSWSGNGGDKKQNVKNNVTLATKVDETRSGNYSSTSTTIATLSLSSVYWKENNGNYSVSSLGEATGFNNGSVTYGNAVCAGQIDFAYSSLNSNYDFKGWYDASGNQLTTNSTYSGYQAGHKDDVTYYAYFQIKAGVDSSTYSLTGDIWNACVTQINGSANGITRGSETDAQWWGSYHSAAAVNTSEGSNTYSITITTASKEALAAITPDPFTTVDIGLYKNNVGQKAFEIGGTYYNYIGGDYTVTSSGVTANIVHLASSNGGGALKLQPGRTYKITINEGVTPNQISVECTSGDKYFLAGQYSDGSTQFFEEQWNTANNELVYNSSTGKYELEFTENIPAGTIQFKTVKNGDSDGWNGGSYPAQNQSYKINANATKVKFSFDATNNTMTVTQENSGGGEGGTWPPTDTAVTNVTGSSTPTSKYLLIADNDAFENGNGKTMTAVALSQKYDDGSNYFYWLDLTDYLSYSNIHLAISTSNSTNGRWSSESRVSDKGAFGDTTKIEPLGSDGTTKLFTAEKKEKDQKYRAEVNSKSNKLNHLGVLIRTNKNNESTYWTEYSFFYTDYVPPVVETKVVDIYAKNGTLRDSNYNRFTNLADTDILDDYFYYAETNASDGTVTEYNSISAYNTAHSSKQIVVTHENAYGNSTYDKMTNVPVGAKIKLQTTLSSSSSTAGSFDSKAFKDTHYLKAYSFNGMTYEVHTPNTGGVYEEIWTVRAVNTTYTGANDILQNATTDGKTVEVTPIYYMKDNKNCKTFYIDGYDGEVQNAWGNMLCVYPYYENVSSKDNAFGGYPGQPMLFWGGKYQMEIPLTVDGTANGASVKGLTLHNAFWDLLHRSIDIRCNARNHAQTYDYDDFYKLYKEKNPDTIIFDFKYRKTHDNYTDGYNYTNYSFAGSAARTASEYEASTHNGVELVTDYFGRQVDAFGNLITDANQSHYGEDNGSGGTVGQTKELLFVSTGYKDTYVGEYSTLWAVYAPSEQMKGGDTANKFIGYISSSMLYLNNIDRRLQYTGGDDTSSGRMSWSSFINTYNHLKTNYVGVPALISYEKEIWNDSKDKANRSDGKWYYSNKSDKVAASIKIQYGSHTLMDAPDHSVSSDAWHDDPFDDSQTGVGGEKNIGTGTGCSAYFTNTTPNLMGKVASGEQFADSTKSFTFLAVPSGSYMFAGWVRYSNGKYYEISEKEAAESPMSANDVYIARFVDAQTGSLTIQHVTEKTDTFNGTGTPSVTVSVKNASGAEVFTDTKEDGSKIDISNYINSHFKDYKIDISLTTTPDTENFMKEIVSSSGNFAPGTSKWNEDKTPTNSAGADTTAKTVSVAQFTVQDILDSGVTSLRYVSHLMMPKYTYNYEITYTYYSRFWGQQSYTQTGTCEEGDFTGAKDTATLTTDFIINKTPYEKTFREQINWNYTTSTVEAGDYDAAPMVNNAAGTAASANTYKMTAHVYASKQVNDRVTAEFVLPYYYNDKSQGYTVHDADVYANAEKPHGQYETEHSYLYDTSHESVTLDTQAYKLFTYDGGDVGGGDNVLASQTHLMEAAPYLMMDGDADHKIQYHYQLVDKSRTYTGNSFKVGEVTYYLNERPEGVPDDNYHKVINSSNVDQNYTVTFTKIKYQGTDHKTTYKYAVAEGTEGTYGYKIYFFSYKMNDQEQMVDNEGNVTTTPVFNGQYVVYSVDREIDGIIKNTGVKKYFTRWDITNTKGEFVASCYNRRFNYSGYDNYVVTPVYDSDEEQHYASSTQNDISASITFLDDSRNQWKGENASGNYATVTGQTDLYAGDKIFTDFAITYNYNGLNLNTVKKASEGGADIKVGMVIERLGELDSVGSTKLTGATYYADKYKEDTSWTAIKTALEGNTSLTTAVRNAGGTGHTCYHEKIASNFSASGYNATLGGTPAQGSTTKLMGFDTAVDNFNRLQWFYTMNNPSQQTSSSGITNATMKNYAYRAISYIMVGDNAYLCDSPTYFTIYDTATRTSY